MEASVCPLSFPQPHPASWAPTEARGEAASDFCFQRAGAWAHRPPRLALEGNQGAVREGAWVRGEHEGGQVYCIFSPSWTEPLLAEDQWGFCPLCTPGEGPLFNANIPNQCADLKGLSQGWACDWLQVQCQEERASERGEVSGSPPSCGSAACGPCSLGELRKRVRTSPKSGGLPLPAFRESLPAQVRGRSECS